MAFFTGSKARLARGKVSKVSSVPGSHVKWRWRNTVHAPPRPWTVCDLNSPPHTSGTLTQGHLHLIFHLAPPARKDRSRPAKQASNPVSPPNHRKKSKPWDVSALVGGHTRSTEPLLGTEPHAPLGHGGGISPAQAGDCRGLGTHIPQIPSFLSSFRKKSETSREILLSSPLSALLRAFYLRVGGPVPFQAPPLPSLGFWSFTCPRIGTPTLLE